MREFYMRIRVDANLSRVLNLKEGSEITPPEMVKALWTYIKSKQLNHKIPVPEDVRLRREERERLAKEAKERKLAKKGTLEEQMEA